VASGSGRGFHLSENAMSILTGYCFGTGSSSSDRTITAKLAAATKQPKFITEGVGSGGRFQVGENPGTTPGNKNIIRGLAFGAGTDHNVAAALDTIDDQVQNMGAVQVNLCGWSRGAVACFKIANAMADAAHRHLNNVPVNIFAFDPVPGDAIGNKHMWQNLSLRGNVNECVIIVAQHERRSEFHAALPPLNTNGLEVDLMPGNHRSILQETSGLEACYRVNLDRCVKFLDKHNTILEGLDEFKLTDNQIIKYYSEMLVSWGLYKQTGIDEGGLTRAFGSAKRTIKDFNRHKIEKLTPKTPVGSTRVTGLRMPFFVNHHHHAETFQRVYPGLYRVLTGASRAGWKPDLKLLAGRDRLTGNIVLEHFKKTTPFLYTEMMVEINRWS
jgi:hypothetical protein